MEEARENVATLIEDYKEFDKDLNSVPSSVEPEVQTMKPAKSKNRK